MGGLAKLMMFGMPANAVGSIDATKRCNLRCEHCYFFAEEHKERDQLIDKLFALKKKYSGKINMLDSTLGLMKSKNSKSVTDNGLFKEKAFTLGADGKPKGKCMMGDNADCDKCGCVVPFYMATMNSPRLLAKEALKKAVGRN